MKPGDRRKRWNQSCSISAVIFSTLSVIALIGVDPPVKYYLVGFFVFMAVWDIIDIKRGWTIKQTRPPYADTIERVERQYHDRIRR